MGESRGLTGPGGSTDQTLRIAFIGELLLAIGSLIYSIATAGFGVFVLWTRESQQEPAAALFIGVLASAVAAVLLALAPVHLMAARKIKSRKSHTFCLVTAGIAVITPTCAPIGTIIGALLLFLLLKADVKKAFQD